MSPDRPFCVYSAKLIWHRGPWVLSWHRKRIGHSRFWLCWPQFRRGIYTSVTLRNGATYSDLTWGPPQ